MNDVYNLVGEAKNKINECYFQLTARKPKFVVVGTGRSGTNYVANRLTQEGLPCLHEKYFRTRGPAFNTNSQRSDDIGEASWMAVPFLPIEGVRIVHVTRHPYGVIKSFYNIGFFHESAYGNQKKYVAFAKRYFDFSVDPLHSAMRWYIEWNSRCAELTSNRIKIEEIDENILKFKNMIHPEFEISSSRAHLLPARTNSRPALVEEPIRDLEQKLRGYPEYEELIGICNSFGYEL